MVSPEKNFPGFAEILPLSKKIVFKQNLWLIKFPDSSLCLNNVRPKTRSIKAKRIMVHRSTGIEQWSAERTANKIPKYPRKSDLQNLIKRKLGSQLEVPAYDIKLGSLHFIGVWGFAVGML